MGEPQTTPARPAPDRPTQTRNPKMDNYRNREGRRFDRYLGFVTISLRVNDESCQAWIAVAHSARLQHRTMSLIRDPQPSSNFAEVAELYPSEKVSDRVRAYLMPGIEHMLTGADLTAPLQAPRGAGHQRDVSTDLHTGPGSH